MKHTLLTAGSSAAAKTNLEEVLLDGQLSLQLSEVGVHEGICCPQRGLVLQLLTKTNLEEVLLDGQLSLQLSEVHTLPTAGAYAAAVKLTLRKSCLMASFLSSCLRWVNMKQKLPTTGAFATAVKN
jgi:hypothetical protein